MASCDTIDEDDDEKQFGMIEGADGFTIEKVADGLTYLTSVPWDDEGNM